ncbi:MAG: DUF6883 domain-containing protein [Oscillospiraceae bacterium]
MTPTTKAGRPAELRYNHNHGEDGRFVSASIVLKRFSNGGAKPVDKSGKRDIMKIGIDNVTGETATIDKDKFTEYALNPKKQPDKAKAFKDALGYDLSNYQLLEKEIRKQFNKDKLTLNGENKQGKKYEFVMNITGVNGKTAKVLTAWIDDVNDKKDFHLTTLHIDK